MYLERERIEIGPFRATDGSLACCREVTSGCARRNGTELAMCSVSSIDELNDDREGDGGRGRQRRM
jgi:hypothetical protein